MKAVYEIEFDNNYTPEKIEVMIGRLSFIKKCNIQRVLMPEYRYFVSYSYTRGFGSVIITADRPIKCDDDLSRLIIESKADRKSENGEDIEGIVILGWQRFEE